MSTPYVKYCPAMLWNHYCVYHGGEIWYAGKSNQSDRVDNFDAGDTFDTNNFDAPGSYVLTKPVAHSQYTRSVLSDQSRLVLLLPRHRVID